MNGLSSRVRRYLLSLALAVSILARTSAILPLSSHVGDEENNCKHQTKTSNNDIADGKEVVLSSKNIGSGKDKMFTAFKGADIEIIDDL